MKKCTSICAFWFGVIPKICSWAEETGKSGRPKIWCIIFLFPNTEMCNLHHMLETHDNIFYSDKNVQGVIYWIYTKLNALYFSFRFLAYFACSFSLEILGISPNARSVHGFIKRGCQLATHPQLFTKENVLHDQSC